MTVSNLALSLLMDHDGVMRRSDEVFSETTLKGTSAIVGVTIGNRRQGLNGSTGLRVFGRKEGTSEGIPTVGKIHVRQARDTPLGSGSHTSIFGKRVWRRCCGPCYRCKYCGTWAVCSRPPWPLPSRSQCGNMLACIFSFLNQLNTVRGFWAVARLSCNLINLVPTPPPTITTPPPSARRPPPTRTRT